MSTATLASEDTGTGSPGPPLNVVDDEPAHIVHFYERDDLLCHAVVNFLAAGLSRGEPTIVIATEAHRLSFSAALAAKGVDVESARAAGCFLMVDADATLAQFMVADVPDPKLFRSTVQPLLEQAAAGSSGNIRAFGEMVDLLWRRGNPDAAIRLEELWNDLQKTRSFSLLCAYVMSNFYKQAGDVQRICRVHNHVHAQLAPDEPLLADENAQALATEISHRKEVERTLRRSLVDLQRKEEALRQSQEELEVLYRLAAAVISATSVDEIFDAAMAAIERALGTDRTSILVFDAGGVMRFRAWRNLSQTYRQAVEGHSPWSRETPDPQPIVSADVETDPGMAAYRPLFREEGIAALGFIPLVSGGRLIGKFMVYYARPHELTPQELELARAIANHVAAAVSRFSSLAELQQTVRFNEMFTGILGHDLRNPLAAIITAAQLAMSREESERLVKPLSRILNSGQRMTRMIDQLLDFTRVRIGAGIPLDARPFDLAPLVRQIIDELDDANPAWTLGLTELGDTCGSWDADRLSQVFSNLVANAVQHGVVEGGVTVTIDGTAGDCVRVEVLNRGVIPSERLPNLFEPLSGGARRLERSRGLGLGLYITREIVKSHGGEIAVHSDAATGTRFVVSLPRACG